MESNGVRELKEHLSHYLRAVRQGRVVEVTVRGEPAARLAPTRPRAESDPSPELQERVWRLATDGFLAWNGQPFQIPDPVAVNRGPRLLSDLVVKDRE